MDINIVDGGSNIKKIEEEVSKLYSQEAKNIEQIRLFTAVSENNQNERISFENKQIELKKVLDNLENEKKKISSEISKKREEISTKAKEMADLICDFYKASEKQEEEAKNTTRIAIENVFRMYQTGVIKKNQITGEISKRIRNTGLNTAVIDGILNTINAKSAEISLITDFVETLEKEVSGLEIKYASISTAYDFTTKNLEALNEQNYMTGYINNDTDNEKPIYSLAKTALATSIMSDKVEAGENINKDDIINANNENLISQEEFTSNWQAYFDTQAAISLRNDKQTQKFLEDFAKVDMTQPQKAQFLVANMPKSFRMGSDGSTLEFIGGTFDTNAFAQFFNTTQSNGNFISLDTTSDIGNTISSNQQIKNLSENYTTIIDTLAKNNFSFKEAMYLLFDSEVGVYKDSGISYDYSNQSSGANYQIGEAGDSATSKFYDDLAKKIEDTWGVSNNRNKTNEKPVETEKVHTVNRDPISFTLDDSNQEFSFVVDRNNDGKFNGSNEFVGAQEGTTWLDDLKSLDANMDGILKDEELEGLKIVGTKYEDNKNLGIGEHQTNIEYNFTNAQKMGIDSIDLNGLEENVNQATGQKDINDAELFNDGFSFNINGKEITASRKDDTTEFLETVYDDAKDNKFEINQPTNEEIDKQFEANLQQAKSELDIAELKKDMAILKGSAQLGSELGNEKTKLLDRIEDDKRMKLDEAMERAHGIQEEKTWEEVSEEITKLAENHGVNIEDMSKLQKIYEENPLASAQDVLNKYENQVEYERSKLVWDSVSECLSQKIPCSTTEISELFEKGTATTVNDVVKYYKEKQKQEEQQQKEEKQQ